MLLTVSRRRPSVFLRCIHIYVVSYCLVTLLLVSLVVFSSTVSIFPIASSFYTLIFDFVWGPPAWAPCRWFLLLGHMGVAFIERRLSLLILCIICVVHDVTLRNDAFCNVLCDLTVNTHKYFILIVDS
jgi:hypothetical protein